MKEAKEALWRIRGGEEVKWKRKNKNEIAQEDLKQLEEKLAKIEATVERIREEERRHRDEDEKRKSEEKRKRETKESRLRKKKMMEERWEMLRWVTRYLEANNERWEKEREVRKKEEKKRLADWDRMARFEKISIIREREKKNSIRLLDGRKENENYRLDENNWLTWRYNDQKKLPSVAKLSPHLPNNVSAWTSNEQIESQSVTELSLPTTNKTVLECQTRVAVEDLTEPNAQESEGRTPSHERT